MRYLGGFISFIFGSIVSAGVAFFLTGANLPFDYFGNVSVHFSPGCANVIIEEISKAKQEILLQAYQITSEPILNALLKQHNEGVQITALIDKKLVNSPVIKTMRNHGISVFIDNAAGIAHNKIFVIDANTVITGSYNFTINAENKNAENLLVISMRNIVAKYRKNFFKRLKSAKSIDELQRRSKKTR